MAVVSALIRGVSSGSRGRRRAVCSRAMCSVGEGEGASDELEDPLRGEHDTEREHHDAADAPDDLRGARDRKSTRLNSSHVAISYAVFCLKKKKTNHHAHITRAGAETR